MIRLIEYFKSKLNHDGVLLLRETHSSVKNESAWVNDFNCMVFFSHGASNSCGVLIAYLGKKSFVLNEQKTDKAGRMLILDITLDADQYILINLYTRNANTEIEQIKILEDLQSLLKNLDISQNKRIIFTDDLDIFFNSKLEAKGGKPLLKRKSPLQN